MAHEPARVVQAARAVSFRTHPTASCTEFRTGALRATPLESNRYRSATWPTRTRACKNRRIIRGAIPSRDLCRDSRVSSILARAAGQQPGRAGKGMACHRLRHGSQALVRRPGCGCESPGPASACTTCRPAGSRTNRLTTGLLLRSRPRAGSSRLPSAERRLPTQVGSCLQWHDPLQARRPRRVWNRSIVLNR